MAGLASAVLALIVLLSAADARGGDFFTGVQLDAESEYFSYLGLKQGLPWEAWGYESFGQLFVSAQSYEYESNDEQVDADVQSIVPSIGIARSIDDSAWNVSLLAGPEFEWKRERGLPDDDGREFEIGGFVQAEAYYWQETHNLHAILSYATLDDFFFARVRGKTRIHRSEESGSTLFVGLDVAGMGNDDYRAIQIGPVLDVPVARFSLIVRGGYQHDSNVGSGGYGGLEFYTPF